MVQNASLKLQKYIFSNREEVLLGPAEVFPGNGLLVGVAYYSGTGIIQGGGLIPINIDHAN